jgi:hypothetical protein
MENGNSYPVQQPSQIASFQVYTFGCAALYSILRRKRYRSIQRKKLYLRMSSVLLNASILAIYGLWKSSEIGQIVLLRNLAVRFIVFCNA